MGSDELPTGAAMSVVVASFRERAALEACLARLGPQCRDVELIVARSDTPDALRDLEQAHPRVRVVALATGSSLTLLRGAGLAAATGALVAITEDNCLPAHDWVSVLRHAGASGADVIGGAMENARKEHLLDWAAFFAEYGVYAGEPHPAGGAPHITAANAAYSRNVVGIVARWMSDGAWENVVHARLHESGARFALQPAARVGQNLRHTFRSFCADRFHHGLDYARGRVGESASLNRWAYAVAAPVVVPALMTLRVARATVGARTHAWAFVGALPFTFAFFTAWAAGETFGYVRPRQ